MRQTPRLPLTISFLTTDLCSLLCGFIVQEKGDTSRQQSQCEDHTNEWGIYDVGFVLICFSSSRWDSLSSVKANEQMLLCCWSQHDGPSCWQALPSAAKKWEGSSGHRTACRGALTYLCLQLFFLVDALISDIQKPFKLKTPPTALYHPLFCPSEPLSAILFNWSLTWNLPLSITIEANKWKGQHVFNKVNNRRKLMRVSCNKMLFPNSCSLGNRAYFH